MMTEEKKANKLNYLRDQREHPTGSYRQLLMNVYNYILNDTQSNGKGWSNANPRKMMSYVYNGTPDHMAWEKIVEWKKELKDLGYINYYRVGNEWRTYIIKELDF